MAIITCYIYIILAYTYLNIGYVFTWTVGPPNRVRVLSTEHAFDHNVHLELSSLGTMIANHWTAVDLLCYTMFTIL